MSNAPIYLTDCILFGSSVKSNLDKAHYQEAIMTLKQQHGQCHNVMCHSCPFGYTLQISGTVSYRCHMHIISDVNRTNCSVDRRCIAIRRQLLRILT